MHRNEELRSSMSLQPCACGSVPTVDTRKIEHGYIAQVACQCGTKGAECWYAHPEQIGHAVRVAIRGWNFSLPMPQ